MHRVVKPDCRAGCWLVDLCAEPVNGLSPVLRRQVCRAGETQLAKASAWTKNAIDKEMHSSWSGAVWAFMGPLVQRATCSYPADCNTEALAIPPSAFRNSKLPKAVTFDTQKR